MPGLTDTAAGYRLWRLLWISMQVLLDVPGWSGRFTMGCSALEQFYLQGFKLWEYLSIQNHKHDVKTEAEHLGAFSVNFSYVWQWTFVLLHLQCDLDLHHQSQKPQRRKTSKRIISCPTGYILQLNFWMFQDPWPVSHIYFCLSSQSILFLTDVNNAVSLLSSDA